MILNKNIIFAEQEVFSDSFTNDNNFLNSEANDRHTPQPVSTDVLVEHSPRLFIL